MTHSSFHRSTPPPGSLVRFGYQPGLDGLRAVSVIAVLLYHAGFGRFSGGFLGVEVFFVISGFLITSLMLEERETRGKVSLRAFWTRRAKRLLPALFAVVVAAAAWTAVAGDAEQQSSLRRELPWSLLYFNNWGQIVGETPYFAADPSMLRHLWSLAIEEQWYLLWPLLFVVLISRIRVGVTTYRALGVIVAVGAAASAIHMMVVSRQPGALLDSPIGVLDGSDRINFLYLSTTTRASGLLLGAAAAFVWRPWTRIEPQSDRTARLLDTIAVTALAVLVIAFATADLTQVYVYQWLLPVVSICSLALAATVTHPDSRITKPLLASPALAAIGRRSYGIYLWSWPISVAVGAVDGSSTRFIAAMAVTAVVSEASYRWIEIPWRRATWAVPTLTASTLRLVGSAAIVAGVAALVVVYVSVDDFDRFKGDETATFDASAATATATSQPPVATTTTTTTTTDASAPADATIGTTSATPTTATPTTATTTTTTTTTTTLPSSAETTRLAIVGDSTANALAVNQPDGIDSIYPTIVNRSRDGCSVYDRGRVLTAAPFRNDFDRCVGWRNSWERAATEADVVLVVIGAWEVFDIQDGETAYPFGALESDQLFTENLRSGIDRIIANGARAALLEIACMRPVESSGSSLPPLPERGDDQRVTHVNTLMRQVADGYGPAVAFVEGPDAWCENPDIANDTRLRWDGVHVYGQGANLIYQTTAASILQLAALPIA